MSIKVCRYLSILVISVWGVAALLPILSANLLSYTRNVQLVGDMVRSRANLLLDQADTQSANSLSYDRSGLLAGVTVHSPEDLPVVVAGRILSENLPNFVPSERLAGAMARLLGAHRGRLPTPRRRMSWRG